MAGSVPAALRSFFPLLIVLCLTSVPGEATTQVKVDFYMEALCPYCANLTLTTFQGMMNFGFGHIMKLRVIPWGNAHFDWASGEVTCQHGKVECEYNELLNCALELNRRQEDFFPFLVCMETNAHGSTDFQATGEACAKKADLDWPHIWDCKSSGMGKKLHLKAGEETSALRPPHQYVPWVVVNGIALQDDDEKLPKFVCAAYTGNDRPDACFALGAPTATGRAVGSLAEQAGVAGGADEDKAPLRAAMRVVHGGKP